MKFRVVKRSRKVSPPWEPLRGKREWKVYRGEVFVTSCATWQAAFESAVFWAKAIQHVPELYSR